MPDFHAYHRDPIYYPWCEDCVQIAAPDLDGSILGEALKQFPDADVAPFIGVNQAVGDPQCLN